MACVISLQTWLIYIPPNLADLPPDVQAYVAAQAAELADLKQAFLGLSLSHATAQKHLEAEATSMNAALTAERTAHAQAILNRAPKTPLWIKVGKQRATGAGVDP